jgi:hypothetical protein
MENKIKRDIPALSLRASGEITITTILLNNYTSEELKWDILILQGVK